MQATKNQAFPQSISVIIEKTRQVIRRHASPGKIQTLCAQRLDLFDEETRKQGFAPCIDFPYHLARGLGAEAAKAEAVSVLCTLIYLGCDLLDDLHDHDLPEDRAEYTVPHVTLASSVFLSVLPTLAVVEFFAPSQPEQMEACRLIAEALALMAAGQSMDVRSRFNTALSVEEVQASISAKSGEEMALFCRLAALVSRKDFMENAAEFGRQLAMALQMASDLTDLFSPIGKDLKEGTFTVPLALHVLRLEKEEKSFFMRVWHESALNPEARRHLGTALQKSGAAAHTAFMIETFLTRGEKELAALPLEADSVDRLRAILEEIGNYSLVHLHAYLKPPPAAPEIWSARDTLLGM